MRLAFLDRPGGRMLARFTAQYGGCGAVSVRIGGKTQPALSNWTVSDSCSRTGSWLSRASAGRTSRARPLGHGN